MKTKRCVRCGRPADHASRYFLDCLHPAEPAPWWLRLLNRLLAGR